MELWETEKYYDIAQKSSLDTKHPGMKLLARLTKYKKKILDMGCGEGTKLSLISKKGTGIDISAKAIELAIKRHPKYSFVRGNIENTPFKDESFDLVYSAYVFEHVNNPEKIIKEAKRILEKRGDLVIICPNYGAPNRASPPYRLSRIKKMLFGFLQDLIYLFISVKRLNWTKVVPIADSKNYEIDWDVTIEPYSLSLEKYLKEIGFVIKKNLGLWSYELPTAKVHQRLFRLFGKIGIYPFYYWSPHIVIQAEKL